MRPGGSSTFRKPFGGRPEVSPLAPQALRLPPRMAFWKKILGTDDAQPVDYYSEGLDLLAAAKFREQLLK